MALVRGLAVDIVLRLETNDLRRWAIVVVVRENFQYLFCQVLYTLGPCTAFQIQSLSFIYVRQRPANTMPAQEKVLCLCCGVKMAPKREREHRRALTGPYLAESVSHPSRQRRIFRASSEADSDEFEGNAVAGPSNFQEADMDSTVDGKESTRSRFWGRGAHRQQYYRSRGCRQSRVCGHGLEWSRGARGRARGYFDAICALRLR